MITERGILISALDSVLHIKGLWRTFYVGSLNQLVTLGCDEVSSSDSIERARKLIHGTGNQELHQFHKECLGECSS